MNIDELQDRVTELESSLAAKQEPEGGSTDVSLMAKCLRHMGINTCDEAAAMLEALAAKGGSTDLAAAKRLRLIAKLLGLEKAIPEDDATMMGALFAVLGMVRYEVEKLIVAKQADAVAASHPNLAAEVVAVLDSMLDGCNSKTFAGYENRYGEEIGTRMDELHAKARAVAPSVQGVPHGWKLVPIVPTHEIRRALAIARVRSRDESVLWADALAASPLPAPVVQQPRNEVLEEAARECEAWGNEKVMNWKDDPEMCEDAKARAWDALQCAAAIRSMKNSGGK